MAALKKYASTSLTQLAEMADLDPRTLAAYFTTEDLLNMVKVGWNPFLQHKKLPPPVVKYIRDKFIDTE